MRHERGDRVMKVKGSEPIAIATTRVGKEGALAKELENALFLSVRNLVVLPLERRGIVIVFGERESVDVASIPRLVKSRGVTRASWIIPVDCCTIARYECVRKASMHLVLTKLRNLPVKMVCRCRKRGLEIDSCSKLCRFVGSLLEDLGLVEVDFRRFDYVLRIEIVDAYAYLSLYQREAEREFRITHPS